MPKTLLRWCGTIKSLAQKENKVYGKINVLDAKILEWLYRFAEKNCNTKLKFKLVGTIYYFLP
jgi:hypothetical protein